MAQEVVCVGVEVLEHSPVGECLFFRQLVRGLLVEEIATRSHRKSHAYGCRGQCYMFDVLDHVGRLELNVDTEVDGLADGIAVGAVALRVGKAVELVPCHEVVGVHEDATLRHSCMFDPFLRKIVVDFYILESAERAVFQEEAVGSLVVVAIVVVVEEGILGVGEVLGFA